MRCIVSHCIISLCIVHYCIPLYCISLHCSVLYHTVLYLTALRCIVSHCIISHYIALYCISLHCTVLYFTVLYLTALHCTGSHVSGDRLKRKFDFLVNVNPTTRALHVLSAVPELGLRYGLDLNSTYGSKGNSKHHLLSSVLTLGPKLLHSFIMEVGRLLVAVVLFYCHREISV